MQHLRTFDDNRHIRQSLSGDDIDDISPCKCRRGDNIRHHLRTFDVDDDDDDVDDDDSPKTLNLVP